MSSESSPPPSLSRSFHGLSMQQSPAISPRTATPPPNVPPLDIHHSRTRPQWADALVDDEVRRSYDEFTQWKYLQNTCVMAAALLYSVGVVLTFASGVWQHTYISFAAGAVQVAVLGLAKMQARFSSEKEAASTAIDKLYASKGLTPPGLGRHIQDEKREPVSA